ncbi:MAG: hypothetical protein GY878_32915 [Fuerstiella sp.]|nr:hypothetical protein [Fuerstiella sp.]
MSQLLIRVLVVCCVTASSNFCSTACCQVFQNSRGPAGRAAATSPGHAVADGTAIDGHGRFHSGQRSGVNVLIPGPIISSRRIGVPSYSNSQYSVPQIDAPGNATVRTYSSRPNGAQYSTRPIDHYGRYQYGNGHMGTHQYIPPAGQYPAYEHPPTQIRIYGRPPIPISPGYGHDYRSGSAPPIQPPYGGPVGQRFPPPYSAVPSVTEHGPAMSPVTSVDERAIVDEFTIGVAAGEQSNVGALDLLRSLRQQNLGDMAFRRGDYASAEGFYRTATETAPSRRASWLRLTWTQVAQQRFAAAASDLKTALHLHGDPTDSWISGSLLYGARPRVQASHQSEQLWNWLQKRPNSTDRLLLTAAFQHLCGDHGTARELLSVAVQNGLPDTLHRAMQDTGQGIHRNVERRDEPRSSALPSTQDTNAPSHASGEDRILPLERRTTPVIPDPLIVPAPGTPEAIDVDPPAIPPIPNDATPAPERSQSVPANLPDRSRQTPVSV